MSHVAVAPPSVATRQMAPASTRRWIFAAIAFSHIAVAALGGGIVARRWYETLYNLRSDNDADVLFLCLVLLWPAGLGAIYLVYVTLRPVLVAASVPAVWISGVAVGLALFNASLLPMSAVVIEGAAQDASAPPPREFTERRAAYVGIAADWQPSALPGQTMIWEGLAVSVSDVSVVDSVPGLPPAFDGHYLLATVALSKRGPYRADWPGSRDGLEVTIDKLNVVPYRGWEVSVPADPVRPGWVDVAGTWQVLPATDFSPQLPVPGDGETVVRRFATFIADTDPQIGSFDRVYVVVHADIERNCRMAPPDIEQICTWQLFPWEVRMP